MGFTSSYQHLNAADPELTALMNRACVTMSKLTFSAHVCVPIAGTGLYLAWMPIEGNKGGLALVSHSSPARWNNTSIKADERVNLSGYITNTEIVPVLAALPVLYAAIVKSNTSAEIARRNLAKATVISDTIAFLKKLESQLPYQSTRRQSAQG